MTRNVNLELMVLAFALLACGRGPAPAAPPPPEPVEWSSTMKSTRNYVPAVREGAYRASCLVSNRDDSGFNARCGGVSVYCRQRNRVVTRGCAIGVPYLDCRIAWERVFRNMIVSTPSE